MSKVRCQMSKAGFSLIEVVVVLGILVVLSGFALVAGPEFYGSGALIAERDSLVSLLRRARTKAMNNVNQADHGVFIAPSEYVLFEGGSYAGRNPELDEVFPRFAGAIIEGSEEIVFYALEGASNASGTIAVSSASGEIQISINYEGRISW